MLNEEKKSFVQSKNFKEAGKVSKELKSMEEKKNLNLNNIKNLENENENLNNDLNKLNDDVIKENNEKMNVKKI
jgi:hypothetical protein